MSLREHVSLREHACVSSRGAQSTELVSLYIGYWTLNNYYYYYYKALHDLAPGYLCELVVPYVPRRVLRSAELNLLTVPPGKPGKYGSRSFARASANLWNSLRGEMAAWLKNSPTLESFKINLKTFLFWERFSS